MTRLVFAIAVLLASVVSAAAQNVHVAVIVGLEGEPEHGELFRRWANTLVDAASGRMAIPRERIIYLTDQPSADSKATGRSTKEEIAKAFDQLARNAKADDVVFIVLIGHGTFESRVAKFNLRGPDMTPAEFAPLLKRIAAQHVVFVNTASASAPFIADLAGPGRTIVTATRTGSERFATLFGGYFIDALTGETADVDRNRRVSVLEAFNVARKEVATAYERQGIMLTEHPLLEDGGDGEGSLEPAVEAKDGRVASVLALGSAADAEPLPSDPKLRQLYVERRDLERRVEALKLMKGGMDPAKYASELERVLTDLALKTKQIREAGGR